MKCERCEKSLDDLPFYVQWLADGGEMRYCSFMCAQADFADMLEVIYQSSNRKVRK